MKVLSLTIHKKKCYNSLSTYFQPVIIIHCTKYQKVFPLLFHCGGNRTTRDVPEQSVQRIRYLPPPCRAYLTVKDNNSNNNNNNNNNNNYAGRRKQIWSSVPVSGVLPNQTRRVPFVVYPSSIETEAKTWFLSWRQTVLRAVTICQS